MARQRKTKRGTAGAARRGNARLGMVAFGSAGQAWHGLPRRAAAQRDVAWLGVTRQARPVSVRLGRTWQAWQARLGPARICATGPGSARPGTDLRDRARLGTYRQAWRGLGWGGGHRRDAAWQAGQGLDRVG